MVCSRKRLKNIVYETNGPILTMIGLGWDWGLGYGLV